MNLEYRLISLVRICQIHSIWIAYIIKVLYFWNYVLLKIFDDLQKKATHWYIGSALLILKIKGILNWSLPKQFIIMWYAIFEPSVHYEYELTSLSWIEHKYSIDWSTPKPQPTSSNSTLIQELNNYRSNSLKRAKLYTQSAFNSFGHYESTYWMKMELGCEKLLSIPILLLWIML